MCEINNKITCPYCGERYFAIIQSTSTCMAYIPIIKDGEEISKNPNTYTQECECLGCGKNFSIVTQKGKTSILKEEDFNGNFKLK